LNHPFASHLLDCRMPGLKAIIIRHDIASRISSDYSHIGIDRDVLVV
jgi:hypothetical protein